MECTLQAFCVFLHYKDCHCFKSQCCPGSKLASHKQMVLLRESSALREDKHLKGCY